MTAYDAMGKILDINELLEALKSRNTGKEPDLDLCKATELLEDYRDLIVMEMMVTNLKVFQETFKNT